MASEMRRAAERHRANLIMRENTVRAEMARNYAEILKGLQADLLDVANTMAQRKAQGLEVTPGYLYREKRYQQLMAQAFTLFKRYEDSAEPLVRAQVNALAKLATKHAQDYLQMEESGIAGGFNRLPIIATRQIAAFVSDAISSPLRQLLQDAWPDAIDQTTNALVRGLALGYNPRKIAKEMAKGIEGGLQRSMLIARTEPMRAYREATLITWRETKRVRGFQRVATHDRRTCPACLFSDGEMYDIEDEMPEHPQGRCVFIPVMYSQLPHEWERGRAWFERQPSATQVSILGPGRYKAWKEGKFQLEDIPVRVSNPVWGDSLQARSLRDLLLPPVVPPKPKPAPKVKPKRKTVPAAPQPVPATAEAYDLSEGTRIRQKMTNRVEEIKTERERLHEQMNALFDANYADAEEAARLASTLKRQKDRERVMAESKARRNARYDEAEKLEERWNDLGVQMRQALRVTIEDETEERSQVTLKESNAFKGKRHLKSMREHMAEALDFVNAVAVTPVTELEQLYNTEGRAWARKGQISISTTTPTKTIIHEIGHNLEYAGGATFRAKRIAFFEKRTAGESLQKLSDIFPGYGYEAREVTKTDKWHHAYVGKVYAHDSDDNASSEIISMGIERLYEDAAAFAAEDPEYFDFVVAYLRGKL